VKQSPGAIESRFSLDRFFFDAPQELEPNETLGTLK